MIRKVEISNFKSISNLSIELGRFNLLIGENGCGKSNILEAIALGAAASKNDLDVGALTSRGIRVTEPEFMRSAFQWKNLKNIIGLTFELDKVETKLPQVYDNVAPELLKRMEESRKNISFTLQNKNKPYSKWFDLEKEEFTRDIPDFLVNFYKGDKVSDIEIPDDAKKAMALEMQKQKNNEFGIPVELFEEIFKSDKILPLIGKLYDSFKFQKYLADFVIFSPENSLLRTFKDVEKIQPLGIKGEGLYKLLGVFNSEKNKKSLKQLKEHLKIIGWFEDFNVPEKITNGEKNLNLKDKYLDSKIDFVNQESANEGFLFLLFYLCLFISEDTPDFFAIDNIDVSFNPKLCSQITRELNLLSINNQKQVILTTHNPFVLDGLDLSDPEQRLFVVRRNTDGHSVITRISNPKSKRKLSEAWMLGYLGGLPNNF